jgi:hypoxanthine phosphoribosyltransferase
MACLELPWGTMDRLVESTVCELISADRIAERVRQLGQQITEDYRGRSLVLLSILKGSFMFTADLARAIDLPMSIEFLGVASYGDGTVSSGAVKITHDLTSPLEGKEVLLIEDIVDTGLTLGFLLQILRARRPASLEVCTLLEKPAKRPPEVQPRYVGFDVGDEFVVGYGLDWGQRFRNLPFIGVAVAGSDHASSDPC